MKNPSIAVVIGIVALILLAVATQSLWRYKVIVLDNRAVFRYDRVTGTMNRVFAGQ